ncbi:hypothetical protein [Dyella psychrodurans]|uniref:Uncharacterized protein n=1 Tax=Dyella psychrodurans TaxID=1927960 RepID=A0A370XCD7_9GAMM|nr:hypothetical protein [Dyella psychrodurans]RDS85937.1 hypothetical protein DWU99_01265 [Dyella psychrodurans]
MTSHDDDIAAMLAEIEGRTPSSPSKPPNTKPSTTSTSVDFSPMGKDEAKRAADALKREAAVQAAAALEALGKGAATLKDKVGALGSLIPKNVVAPAAAATRPVEPTVEPTDPETAAIVPTEPVPQQVEAAEESGHQAEDAPAEAHDAHVECVSTTNHQEAAPQVVDSALAPESADRADMDLLLRGIDDESPHVAPLQSTAPNRGNSARVLVIGGVVAVLCATGGWWALRSHAPATPPAVAAKAPAVAASSPAPTKPAMVPAPAVQPAPPASTPPAAAPVPNPQPTVPTSPNEAGPVVTASPALPKPSAPSPVVSNTPTPAPAVDSPKPQAAVAPSEAPVHRGTTQGPKAKPVAKSEWQDKADAAMDAYLKNQH